MITKVKEYMEKYHMVHSGDSILVGLSGGADSVCLLFLLKKISEEIPISLKAAHINHGLRKESDEEELFVKNLCKDWEIPCEIISVDVNAYAKEHHMGIEEAARVLRYEAFEHCASEKDKIALAQHQNDQAETVLFHLFRGSGMRGLTGIRPVRDRYIRPLLCVSRQEIEDFIKASDLQYVTDCTNFDTVYARNKIRHEILPKAEEISGKATEHIAKSAQMISDAADFLEQTTQTVYSQLVIEKEKSCSIAKEKLSELHPYLQSALVYEMLYRVSGRKKDISAIHVDSILSLLKGQSGRKIDLIYGMQAVMQQQELMICKITDLEQTDLEATLSCCIFSYEKTMDIPDKPYTKWFDYDKITSCPILRGRRSGDYFYCGDSAKKKLQDYFVNEKIPLLERDKVLLVADEDHIMWIVGKRISNYYKITDETKQVLEITISGGEQHE